MSFQSRYCYYPRGYRLLIETEPPLNSQGQLENASITMDQGDEEVNELFRLYRTGKLNRHSSTNLHKAVRLARLLYPNPNAFFYYQHKNPYLHGHNYEFLEEIRRMMLGIQPQMSPMNALEFMDDPCRYKPVQDRERPRIEDTYITGGRYRWIGNWLSIPQGFEAMVCTLYVLFGSSRVDA